MYQVSLFYLRVYLWRLCFFFLLDLVALQENMALCAQMLHVLYDACLKV